MWLPGLPAEGVKVIVPDELPAGTEQVSPPPMEVPPSNANGIANLRGRRRHDLRQRRPRRRRHVQHAPFRDRACRRVDPSVHQPSATVVSECLCRTRRRSCSTSRTPESSALRLENESPAAYDPKGRATAVPPARTGCPATGTRQSPGTSVSGPFACPAEKPACDTDVASVSAELQPRIA